MEKSAARLECLDAPELRKVALFSFRGGVKSHKCVATVAEGGERTDADERTAPQQCEHVLCAADKHTYTHCRTQTPCDVTLRCGEINNGILSGVGVGSGGRSPCRSGVLVLGEINVF